MNYFQFWDFLFRLGQCVLLFVVVRVGRVSRDDVLLSDAASVDRTFTRIDPVFSLCQCVVIHATALLQPVKHLGFLVKTWINSVAIGQVQHSYILTDLHFLLERLCLLSQAREPFCIPTLIEAIERGTYPVPQSSNQLTLDDLKCSRTSSYRRVYD